MLSQQQERKWNTICYQQLIQDTFQRTYCNRYICNYWQSTILLIYAVIVEMQKSPCYLKQSKYKGKEMCNVFWYNFQGSLVCKEVKTTLPHHPFQLLCSQLSQMPKLTQIFSEAENQRRKFFKAIWCLKFSFYVQIVMRIWKAIKWFSKIFETYFTLLCLSLTHHCNCHENKLLDESGLPSLLKTDRIQWMPSTVFLFYLLLQCILSDNRWESQIWKILSLQTHSGCLFVPS